ncbi:MAG: SDR family oxidoreductase [Chloroflexaceae bacterium]|nr:SDR family oxidoreductase [Chloroflexaceae bacterium]
MQPDFKGQVVCVTGSARRVGRAIMLAFAERGAHVVIHHGNSDADAASAAEEARAAGVEALVLKADLADPAAIEQLFKDIQAHYDRLDVLVNSAANFKRNQLLDISLEEWHSVIDTNLRAPFLATQHAARLMITGGRGGVILNISDNSGLHGWAERGHHSIAKAGILMLTRVSAKALAEHQIRVNCVVPGPVLVPAGASPAVLDSLADMLPLKRIGTPEHIAQAMVFLASNDFATGSVLSIDGGEGLVGTET